MSKRKTFRRTKIGDRTLHPATQMMSYGYDPSMSEGAVKPPVGITDGLIRLSIGLEEPADLIEDLKEAFTKSAQGAASPGGEETGP